jgi:hypothetical protein
MKKISIAMILFMAGTAAAPAPARAQTQPAAAMPREVERLQKRQQDLNRQMKAKIEEVEREHPALVEKNKTFEQSKSPRRISKGH